MVVKTDEEILEEYIEKFFKVDPDDGVRRRGMAKHGKQNFTTWREIVTALYHSEDINEAATKLHYGTTRRASDNDDAPRKGMEGSLAKKKKALGMSWAQALGKDNFKSWKGHIQQSVGYNQCTICAEIKELKDFKKLNDITGGVKKYNCDVYRNECHGCYSVKQGIATKKYKEENPGVVRASSARRRAAKLQRTVAWGNKQKIDEFYDNCPEGYTVDHILPLQGAKVSGLHVENNLQYLTPSENSSKGNTYEP